MTRAPVRYAIARYRQPRRSLSASDPRSLSRRTRMNRFRKSRNSIAITARGGNRDSLLLGPVGRAPANSPRKRREVPPARQASRHSGKQPWPSTRRRYVAGCASLTTAQLCFNLFRAVDEYQRRECNFVPVLIVNDRRRPAKSRGVKRPRLFRPFWAIDGVRRFISRGVAVG